MTHLRSRLKYHSTIAALYIQHKEHLLPTEFRRSIPYSTISTWRNLNTTSFAGHEFCNIQNQGLEWVELFQKHQYLKKTITILCKVLISLHDIFIPAINKNKAYLEQDKLIIEIEHPCPEDFLFELKNALIVVLQDRELNEVTDLKEFKETNWSLLEVLRCIIR